MSRFKIRVGECLATMRGFPARTFHASIADPPASISYQHRDWDLGSDRGKWIGGMAEIYSEVRRVCRPGAYVIAWGIPRRSHWMATALEDAGLEIRDIVHHCFPRGMPAGLTIELAAKDALAQMAALRSAGLDEFDLAAFDRLKAEIDAGKFKGLRTMLKPAVEHWIVSRVPLDPHTPILSTNRAHGTAAVDIAAGAGVKGQWPGNLCAESELWDYLPGHAFWCPKPPWSEKEAGCEDIEPITGSDAVRRRPGTTGMGNGRAGAGRTRAEVRNSHPTVKAVQLMRHLVRVFSPPGGSVLDPFCGSGSTGVGALLEGRKFSGIELDERFAAIATSRCRHAEKGTK
jgi:site-specific DNA-methyltransferase (adenine-specific)